MLNSNIHFPSDWVDPSPAEPPRAPTKNGHRSEQSERALEQKFANKKLQYINFDRNTLKVDRVVSCSEMFDIIHPKKAGKIMSKWSDSIVKVVQILINFRCREVR